VAAVTRRALAVVVFVALAVPARAATIRVPEDAATIAAGLAAAAGGDTVTVAAGTYAGPVTLRSGVTLRGAGAPGAATIDGLLAGPCVDAVGCEPGTRLEGFRLVRGRGVAEDGTTVGGALRALGGVLEVSDCTFEDARATFGGATAGAAAQLRFVRCTWSGPVGSFGGGHFQSGGRVILEDALFTAPQAIDGGALYATNGAIVTVDGATVRGARASGDGAGMRLDACVATLADLRLEDGLASGRGGGLALAAGAQVVGSFCTFLRNAATGGGGAFWVSCDAASPGELLGADCALLSLAHADILASAGGAPAAGAVTSSAVVRIGASVIVGNASGLACLDSRATLDVTCSDLYANGGADLSGLCAPPASPTNLAVDPHLCGLATGDLGRCANSPLLDPGCADGEWGAAGVACGACGPTPATTTTWGRLKSRYR
jgi:hypothetical protein